MGSIATLLVLGAIGVAAAGCVQNVRYGDQLAEDYGFFLGVFFNGVGNTIAIIGLYFLLNGSQTGVLTIIGLGISTFFMLPNLKIACNDVANAKKVIACKAIDSPEEVINDKSYKKIGPVWVYLRLSMLGLGKVIKFVVCTTLVGIPFMKAFEAHQAEYDAYCTQSKVQLQLKNELEAMNLITEINLRNRKNKSRKSTENEHD